MRTMRDHQAATAAGDAGASLDPPADPDRPGGHDGRHGHDGHDGHAGHDPAVFRDRFWLSLLLTIPIVLTSETIMDWFGYQLDFPGIELIGPVLGTVVLLYGGWPFLAGGAAEARNRQPGMMLLIAMAIVVAYTASLATSFGLLDLEFWWELAALVTVMLFGHWQEMRAIGQARGALATLAELLPDDAERIDEGTVTTVPVAALEVGDVVLVRPGARVPADGEVVDGAAELDESMVTGESRPVPREVGDRVVAGTIATDSSLRVRVDATGDDTTLAGIQRLVAEAQSSGSRAQALADRFAGLLFYIAVAAATLTFAAWVVLGDGDDAVVRTVTVLVIACPHALGLAIPLVISLSTALSARAGILVKDRLALERMRTIDTVLLDKTGTLTEGRHAVTAVAAAPGHDEAEVLRLAGGVESESEHPLAKAIVQAATERGKVANATGFRSLPGRGVQATVDGAAYAVGGPALLRERGLAVPAELEETLAGWRDRGATVLHLVRTAADGASAPTGQPTSGRPNPKDDGHRGSDGNAGDGGNGGRDGEVVGALSLEDTVRPEAAEALAQLRALGIDHLVMITGDAREVADSVARELGIDEVFAEVLPEDKDRAVTELQERGLRVAMVGDGVNDAPALARADVGIAIGAGTDVAIESAGVVLGSSDPRAITSVVRLSQASYRKMIQNLGWAAGYNVVAIPLAAGVLAWAGITLAPAVGALLMSGSTVVVAFNAQLLRRVDLTPAPAT